LGSHSFIKRRLISHYPDVSTTTKMTNIRTSQTDPLQIATITLPWLPGRIGLTICPGKKGESTFGGPWYRDLETDLTVVREWGAGCLVTLMEKQELHILEVDDLPAKTEQTGMDWLHLPIRDLEVPHQDWLRKWKREIGPDLRRRLLQGERIAIHCRGGLGRSGLVAGLLLRDLGIPPEDTIPMIRRARPGAVETAEQEEYVKNYIPWTGRQTHAHYLVCLRGGAVGDALGWPVEFSSLDEIQSTYGPRGITCPIANQQDRFEITDDTQMSLFTAEALLLAHQRAKERGVGPAFGTAARRAYLRWLHTQGRALPEGTNDCLHEGWLIKEKDLFAKRAPGNSCLSALESGEKGLIHRPINNSKGCGTVMRVAPVGLFMASPEVLNHVSEEDAGPEAFRIGCEISAVTHGHPSGYLAGGYLAMLICRLIAGDSLEEGMEETRRELVRHQGHEEVVAALDTARSVYEKTKSCPTPEAVERIGEGWVAEEALAIAIYCCLGYPDDFEKAVLLAVNHGGDSDSTGAVTGNIMGLLHGMGGMLLGWANRLELAETVETMASNLFRSQVPGNLTCKSLTS